MLVFLVGLLLGFLSGVVIVGFMAYRIVVGSNNVAVAKFLNGLAQGLAHQPKPSGRLPPAKEEESPVAKKAAAEKPAVKGVWV